MLAGPRGGDGLADVQVVRRGNGNDLDGRVVEHLLQMVVGSGAREAVFFRLRVGALLVAAHNGAHGGARVRLKRFDVRPGYPAGADDPHAQCIHTPSRRRREPSFMRSRCRGFYQVGRGKRKRWGKNPRLQMESW